MGEGVGESGNCPVVFWWLFVKFWLFPEMPGLVKRGEAKENKKRTLVDSMKEK